MKGSAIVEGLEAATPPADTYGIWWAWYALVVFVLQVLASGVDVAIVTLLVHPIEAALRTNDVGFAAITAMPVAIGLTVAYYPGGLLADTFRRRDVIAVGSIIWILAALLASRTDSAPMLFLARLLAGIGTGLPGPAIFSMLSDAFPRSRRALAVGVCWSGFAIGIGVGLAICGALVAATQHNGLVHIAGIPLAPWQQCFVAVAAIGVIILVLVLTVPEPQRRDRVTHADSNLGLSLRVFGEYLRRHWLLWLLLLGGGAVNCTGYFAINSWGPAFGMRHYGATGVSSVALLGTFFSSGSLLGTITAGFIAQRGTSDLHSRLLPRMFAVMAVIACAFSAIFPFAPTWLLAVIGIGAVSTAVSAQSVLMASAIQEAASNEVRGQLFGVWGFIVYIPSIGAATLVAFLASGALAKTGGLGSAMAIVGGITSALAILLFAFSGAPYERARRELRALIAPGSSQAP